MVQKGRYQLTLVKNKGVLAERHPECSGLRIRCEQGLGTTDLGQNGRGLPSKSVRMKGIVAAGPFAVLLFGLCQARRREPPRSPQNSPEGEGAADLVSFGLLAGRRRHRIVGRGRTNRRCRPTPPECFARRRRTSGLPPGG